MNDVEVKDLKIKYDNEEMSSEIRKYILKHLQNLNQVLASIELSDAKLNEEKSQFCQSEIVIVEYACDYDKRHSEAVKVVKIVNWSFCESIIEAKVFISVCVYYQSWIRNFSVIAKSIFMFFKKNWLFLWKNFQMQVMKIFKTMLMTAFTLRSIEYEEEKDEIICAMNVNDEKWRKVLMQQEKNEKCCHIIYYESRLWSEVEKKYNAKKHEYHNVLKMLKKCQKYLYEI